MDRAAAEVVVAGPVAADTVAAHAEAAGMAAEVVAAETIAAGGTAQAFDDNLRVGGGILLAAEGSVMAAAHRIVLAPGGTPHGPDGPALR